MVAVVLETFVEPKPVGTAQPDGVDVVNCALLYKLVFKLQFVITLQSYKVFAVKPVIIRLVTFDVVEDIQTEEVDGLY